MVQTGMMSILAKTSKVRVRNAIKLAVMATVIVILCNDQFWIWMGELMSPPVLLTRNLPAQIAAMPHEFEARLKARFPVGSFVNDMLQELRRENFVVGNLPQAPDQEQYASRQDGGNWTCSFTATVFWNADDKGHLTAIRGDYRATCL